MVAQNQNQSLWRRLKRAVRIVLSRTWRMASVIRRAKMSKTKPKLCFNDCPGLKACTGERGYVSEGSGSSRGSRQGKQLQRTLSYSSDDDDIDRRAEMFIANFRRQLQMERQISLRLRYMRGDSFELVSP
ncbi:hypothetical protein L6164_011632 [Bauhinia variegata]|uniref:Uncharacterized protein n=1 Tax=Bauhinia variegata TaxID=167791 RepID=A0ACB9P7J2_BAUVA|nr:hypothetical protein L6164_011632 [Bauhinia variegata]